VVSGQFPTRKSRSLLFNNEDASYGQIPTNNLYITYWEKYINFLYNPKTRLLNASAIIPLADYVKMELNDIVNFRGNYYHLRAINDYSLKTGECTLQLLGPIIRNAISDAGENLPTPPSTASIQLKEIISGSGTGSVFIDASLIVSGTTYLTNGNFSQSISGGAVANVILQANTTGSTIWGGYTTASATLLILDNDSIVSNTTQFIYSGSGNTTITIPTTFTSENIITISGSTNVAGEYVPVTATLNWSFTKTNATSSMNLYVNNSIVGSGSATTSGSYTVGRGDSIYATISTTDCTGSTIIANANTSDIISASACASGSTSLTTSVYIVLASDMGKTITLATSGSCNEGCI
jgi:hypothetical protein